MTFMQRSGGGDAGQCLQHDIVGREVQDTSHSCKPLLCNLHLCVTFSILYLPIPIHTVLHLPSKW